jgi:hypothetical protein
MPVDEESLASLASDKDGSQLSYMLSHGYRFKGYVNSHPSTCADYATQRDRQKFAAAHAWILLHDKILTTDNLQKKGDDHTKTTVSYVMVLRKQDYTYLYHAPLQEPYGLRCYLGKILLYSCHNKNLPQSPLGGNTRLARCQGRTQVLQWSFYLHYMELVEGEE